MAGVRPDGKVCRMSDVPVRIGATRAASGQAARVSPARVAGVLYVTVVALGVFAEVGVRSRLIEDGDAGATAANILGSQWLFRLGFAADLVVFLCDVGLAVLLYVLFRRFGPTLALLAGAFRLTQTAIIGLNLLSMYAALLILRDSGYLGQLEAGESEALALLMLDMHAYGYTLGLTFFGVSTILIAVLGLRSQVVPRLLCWLLVLAGAGYLGDSFAFFLVPGYEGSISPILLAPAIVAEVWFALWLLFRGRALEERPA
jgi:hypothetical protein